MTLPRTKIDDTRPRNIYKVPVKSWRKWTLVGKHTFNKLFGHMIQNPEFYRATKASPVPPEHFRVTSWNAAWMAADITSRGETALLKELVRDIKGYDDT